MCEQALSSRRRPQLIPVACLLLAVAVCASPGAAKPTGEDETAKTAASTKPPPVSSPLAGLPSKPGPQVELIRGMGPDAWLELGPPAADPQWGRARGRSWTPKMAYAADLRVAWLYGSGQHGFVKPDGRYQDDLWAYDVSAGKWERPYVEGPGPDQRCESVLEDLPGRGQAFFLYHHGVVWLYDYATKRWTDTAPRARVRRSGSIRSLVTTPSGSGSTRAAVRSYGRTT